MSARLYYDVDRTLSRHILEFPLCCVVRSANYTKKFITHCRATFFNFVIAVRSRQRNCSMLFITHRRATLLLLLVAAWSRQRNFVVIFVEFFAQHSWILSSLRGPARKIWMCDRLCCIRMKSDFQDSQDCSWKSESWESDSAQSFVLASFCLLWAWKFAHSCKHIFQREAHRLSYVSKRSASSVTCFKRKRMLLNTFQREAHRLSYVSQRCACSLVFHWLTCKSQK